MTPSDSQAQALSQQLHAAAARNSSPDANRAALDMITNMVWREADVITANQMFLLLGGIFFAALLLMPLVRKLDMAKSGAGH